MTIESRVDTKDMDKRKVRELELIAEKASRQIIHSKEREKYMQKGMDYINTIHDEEHKKKYIRIFLDMIKEYDTSNKKHIEEQFAEGSEKWWPGC